MQFLQGIELEASSHFLAVYNLLLYAVASTIGAAFVFPGVATIDGGAGLSQPPFLSGLGPVFLTWLVGPMLSLTSVTLLFLLMRTCLLRGEDPFHKVLWVSIALCSTVTPQLTMP